MAGFLPASNALENVEQRIRTEYGAAKVILTASGTVALALAFLAAAPRGKRPRIALPAWGCYDLMTAADAVEAEVLLYDLDPARLAPDDASLRVVLDRGADILVVAHWFGIPVDLEPIHRLARDRGVLVVDDAAQAVGAAVGGRPVGSQGDFGVLSFGRGKGRTGGSGGALFANTDRARSLLGATAPGSSSSGLGSFAGLWAQVLLGRPATYWVPRSLPFLRLGETVYRSPPDLLALSVRSAAVLDRNWDASASEVPVRREHARRWLESLPWNSDLRRIELESRATPGWLRCPVRATGRVAAVLSSRWARRRGVERGYPRSLADLPVPQGRIGFSEGKLTGSRHLAAEVFSLPTHGGVTETDFEIVKEVQP